MTATRKVDRGGRLTTIQRRALEVLRSAPVLRSTPLTAAQLAKTLWPESDLYHTTKTAAGVLARLRNEGGLVRRTAPAAITYEITRAGRLVLVQDELLGGVAVLLDGRPVYPLREATPPCRVAVVADAHEPTFRHRLQAERGVLRLSIAQLQHMLPAMLSTWLDEVS